MFPTLKLGCHISISEGFAAAAARARDLGADSFQYFTKNPRGFGGARPLNLDDVAAGLAFCAEHGMAHIAHAPYILNLSTPDEAQRKRTVDSLLQDLQIANQHRTEVCVVHCGKHVEKGPEYGLERMVETIDHVLERYEGSALICLENTAGQGSEMGTTLEELVAIRDRVRQKERVGFCWDSCHAFVAGEWQPETWSEYMARMKQSGYLDHLKAIHLNDSRAEFGSHRDRHELVGKGFIGAGLEKVLNEPAFQGLPVVLETPIGEEREYAVEIAWCRGQLRPPAQGSGR